MSIDRKIFLYTLFLSTFFALSFHYNRKRKGTILMKRSVMRVTCAFLLLTIALASSVGLISAVFARPAAPPTVESRAKKPDLVLVRLLIKADADISSVVLQTADGTVLQTLIPDAEGEAVTQPMQPAAYTAVFDGGRVDFTLHENASVTTGEGFGWTDGEQLHLTRTPVGSVTVYRTLSADEPALAGGWADYTLMGGGYYDRAVLRVQSVVQTEASCTFFGVPYGRYVLSENGVQRTEVEVTAENPHPEIRLGA